MRARHALALVAVLAGCQAEAQSPPQQARCEAREAINPSSTLPYSQAVRAGGAIYFAGKVGATAETRAMTEGRIQAETRNVMESFKGLFEEIGVGFEDVVMGNVYLADIADYAGMNDVYGEYFPTDPPARVALAVNEIPAQGIVEISFIAACN
ncbi:MAG: Rid family hydrolase [Gemmatimonadota bacterium]